MNPSTRRIETETNAFVRNTIPSLKADSISAFEALERDPLVDQSRIGVAGGSEGTWTATVVGLRHPETKEVVLISSPIERFDVSFAGQVSHLIPDEIMARLDKDHSGSLSKSELSDPVLSEHGLLSFDEIDRNQDGEIDADELAADLNRAVMYSLATGDNRFLLSDFTGGVSMAWLRSAIAAVPLGPEVLRLSMPTRIYHGTADRNTSVGAVRKLQARAEAEHLGNLSFTYYEGLGHELTPDILAQILGELAERISR